MATRRYVDMAYKNSNDDDDVNIYDKLFLHVQNEVIDSLETHFNTHNNINSEEIEEEEEMNEEEKEKELKRIEKQIKDSRERSLLATFSIFACIRLSFFAFMNALYSASFARTCAN
mgnify:CR=1 FL=1